MILCTIDKDGSSGFAMVSPQLFVFWVILHVFCRMLKFFKINIFENFFQEYHKSV